ncbi:MAG: DUF4350 domain-containing protein, partial [Myxococcaceae bacterium]
EFADDESVGKKHKKHEETDEDDDDPSSADAGVESRHGMNLLFVDPVSPDERDKLLEHIKKGNTVLYAPPSANNNSFLKALGVYPFKPEVNVPIRSLVPDVPTPYTLGVQRTEAHVEAFFDSPDDATPLLVDDRSGEVAVVRVPYGAGDVIVIGAPELGMNGGLARADNAQFWLSLLTVTAGNRPTAFDEFHHGFGGSRSIAEFARRYGLHFAIAQLLLGLSLWALALKRFGRPKPPKDDERVGATDALFGTSRLYREGRHFSFSAQLIVKELVLEMARAAGVPAKSEPSVIADSLRMRGRARVASAFEQVLGAARNVSTEADVRYVADLAAVARALLNKRDKSPKPLAA